MTGGPARTYDVADGRLRPVGRQAVDLADDLVRVALAAATALVMIATLASGF